MKLVLKLDSGESISHVSKKNTVIIGRSPKCDIVLNHEGMSRQHCQIDVEKGELYITDLGSTNGVKVDGKKITPGKKTPFFTFLSVTFGIVKSVEIHFD